MQKNIPLALVMGALIIGVALVYHARQLVELTAQLQATQQQMASLDTSLQDFASDLPKLIEDAGRNAGRQAVHGMAEEAVQMPLNWLNSTRFKSASDALRRILAAPNIEPTNNAVPLSRPSPPNSDAGFSP